MHARHSKDRIAIDQRAQDWAAHRSHPRRAQAARLCSIFAALVVTLALSPTALADPLPNLTVIGVAPNGTETPLTDYRWLVEEDQTYHVPVNPDETAMGGVNFAPNWQQGSDGHDGGQTLSVSFHDSYMPVVAKGCSGDAAWQTAATCSDV